jgi:hypothetical protein
MIRTTIALLLLLASAYGLAPRAFATGMLTGATTRATGTLTGKVFIEDDQPAVGATVALEGTRFGVAVDTGGEFTLSGLPEGVYAVRVRLVGYEQGSPVEVRITEGDTSSVVIRLRQELIEISGVEVTGSRRLEAEDVRPSVTKLLPRESKMLPGAAEDVLRSLQALPGVTSVSDFSSQLVVRGSGPDQNLILIDGFEVINPYRLYGFISMFNPETVSDISLQTGGFAAQYGDRLSAVLDVQNRDGKTDVAIGGKINTSLTNMNALIEGRLPLGTGSYLFSVRRTYYDLILGPVLRSAKLVKGEVALPNFTDFQGKLGLSLGQENKLIFTGVTSRDGVDLISGDDRPTPDSVNVFDESYNTLTGMTWQYNPSPDFISQTHLSWYRNTGTGAFDGTFVDPAQNTGDLGRDDTVGIRFLNFGVDYEYRYTKTSLAQQFLAHAGTHLVEFGAGVDFLRTDFTRYFKVDQAFLEFLESVGQSVPTDASEAVRYNRYNAFVQDKIAIGNRLFVQPGLRLDYYPVLGTTTYLSPRLNISFKIDELSTLRAAYGIYYQSPGMDKLDYRFRVIYNDVYFSTLSAERADHYVLGVDRLVSPEWQVKIEGYYKRFQDLVVQEKLAGSSWQTTLTGSNPYAPGAWTTPVRVADDSLTSRPVNDAVGESYGFEFMFQKIRTLPSDRFTGWVSYALAFAERDRGGLLTPFLFDQRHAVNVVGNYRFAERWDIGAKFTLRTGRPYQIATGVKPRVIVAEVNGVEAPIIQVDGWGKAILDVEYEQETLSGRQNLYHTLDVRITTYPRWWGLDWSVYLDVQNVYNRENEQAVRYYIDEEANLQRRAVYGIPIFPSLGLSLAF